jgi:hypothetical protein
MMSGERHTAVHEAGHAVIGRVLRLRLIYFDIFIKTARGMRAHSALKNNQWISNGRQRQVPLRCIGWRPSEAGRADATALKQRFSEVQAELRHHAPSTYRPIRGDGQIAARASGTPRGRGG